MRLRLLIISLLISLLGAEISQAQSSYEERRNELQQQQEMTRSEIESLNQQIETYQNRLQLASERHEEMYQRYEELTRLIALQDERIRRMEQEQQQISREIRLVEENLAELRQELEELIARHQRTLTYLYKHGRTTELALILTSASINQLLVRSTYLARFNEYREAQESAIRNAQAEYELARADLQETQERNRESLDRIQSEKEQLAHREEQQQENIQLLQRDRNQLEQQLTEVTQQQEELNETLTRLIDEEEEVQQLEEERLRRLAEAEQIEDEEEREAAVARYSRPNVRRAAVSEAELATYEQAFRESRGQLPWPIEGGTVTEQFGERVHPVFGTRTNNPGIDIAAPSGSQVRTIHDGYVFAVQPLTGFGEVVMVHHGQYKTVYGNLSDIFVTRGHVLSRGDVIGLSGDEDSIRGEVLFFMIRDGSRNVNPEAWLQRANP